METELVIVGAGPTGLFATFVAGLRDIKSVTIDALSEPGGQITNLYPEKIIYDMPGFPKIKGKDLAKAMYEQAKMFNSDIRLGYKVTDIIPRQDGKFDVEINQNEMITAASILLCTGVGSFEPNKLGVKGEDEYYKKGVDYTAREFDTFKNKNVMIVGGGDSAFDFAQQISSVAEKIYLVHHSDVFRAEERIIDIVKGLKNVQIITNTNVQEIKGDGNKVISAVLMNNKTNTAQELPVNQIVIATGHKIEPNAFKSIKLETTGRYIKVNNSYETSVKGIFAAGDIANVLDEPKFALLATGVAEAYIAVNNIKKYLKPTSSLMGEHSSNLKL